MKARLHTILLLQIIFTLGGLQHKINAQTIIVKGTLDWELKTISDANRTRKTVLYSKEGTINDSIPMSVIQRKIDLTNGDNASFKFLYNSFEPTTDNEMIVLDNMKSIQDSIVIHYSIQTEKKQKQLLFSFLPIRKNPQTGKYEKLIHYIIEITPEYSTLKTKSVQQSSMFKESSILQSGSWFTFTVTKNGVHQIFFNELKDLGLSNPELVKIYGNGGNTLPEKFTGTELDDLIEMPIYIEKGSDGIFNSGDYILFYAQGPEVWTWDDYKSWYSYAIHPFASKISYFITSGTSGKKITLAEPPSGAANQTVSSYDFYSFHENNLYNLIRSGREFYGENFNSQTSYDFNFDLSNLVTGEKVLFESEVLARSTNSTTFNLKYNNQLFTSASISALSGGYDYAYKKTVNTSFTPSSGNLKLTVQYDKNGDLAAEGWLNYIKIWARQNLNMVGYQFEFRDKRSVNTGNISQFKISGTTAQTFIWDITDFHNIIQYPTNYQNNQTTFTAASDELKYYIAFDYKNGLLRPVINKTPIANQNLHALNNIEYIIVSHPNFIKQATELAEIRRTRDNLNTLVVTPQEIYNEFSSGNADPAAIRNFAKSIYEKTPESGKELKYMLLFGDGSYDNKSSNEENTNYVLTYESLNSVNLIGSYVSDDYFGILDNMESIEFGLIDIGIGRFPVKDTIEANIVLTKLKDYYKQSTLGDWRNMLCFIGDDDDTEGTEFHMKQADDLALYVEKNYPNFNFDKIYLDAFQQVSTSSGERYPDAKTAIYNRINQGALIMNYTGHGNEHGLSSELIITQKDDIKNWKNTIYPVFITATCEFSRFDDYETQTGGEDILLSADGGGIALLSTTRLVYSSNNFRLNYLFYQFAFTKDANGNPISLGEIIRKTKNTIGYDTNKHNFTLLGDPAFKLPYPVNDIKTDSINGLAVSVADTIKAFQNVTISGSITDEKGIKLNNFNGIVYPTIYDKSKKVTSLVNDAAPAFTFVQQKDVLFKGQASVKNGEFNFSFILPRDIDYNYDFGKISYYAKSDNDDAAGQYNKVIIGGLYSSAITDDAGPEINLFINDSTFKDGGITNEYPKLFAKINDNSGLNIGGQGIGHDLVATLDNNLSVQFILNTYYQTNVDNFKSGELVFQLPQLSPGMHTLSLKAWDVLNNSSQEKITFKVLSGNEPYISNVKNFPNPLSNSTTFSFDHNMAEDILAITIDIFNMNGKPVAKIEKQIEPSGFTSGPINWDNAQSLPHGIYLYRITLKSESGVVQSETKKLVKIENQ